MDARQKSRFEGARVVTANRLIDGRVVWFTARRDWSERIDDAEILPPGPAGAVLDAAKADTDRRLVVDVYEVDLQPGREGPVPMTERERIRAFGPSTHPQFAPRSAAA